MKSEKFSIVLYPESESMIIEYIKLNYKYAGILHDKDVDETGEIKKEHYHFVVLFNNAKDSKTLANEIGVEEHRIQFINSKKYSIRYLIHFDQPEKYQYKFEDIETNIEDLKRYFNNEKSESQEMRQILEYIYSIDRFLYYHEVLEFALYENIYSTYRRAGNNINKLVDEHNRFYKEGRRRWVYMIWITK